MVKVSKNASAIDGRVGDALFDLNDAKLNLAYQQDHVGIWVKFLRVAKF